MEGGHITNEEEGSNDSDSVVSVKHEPNLENQSLNCETNERFGAETYYKMENRKLLMLGGFGLWCIIGGFIMSFYLLPKIVQGEIQKKLELKNGSEMYPMWQKLPIPIIFNAYLFNVTNPKEISNGEKPILKEVGPFCYNLYREKIILDVSSDGNQITYNSTRIFFERHDEGCISTETEVTILNLALMGTVHIMLNLIPDFLSTFEETIPLMFPGIKNVFTTAKAKDILFNGLLLDCSDPDGTLGLVCSNIKGLSPPQVWQLENGRDYKFAALKYMNGTSEGIFRVNSGINSLQLLGNTEEWMGENALKYWQSERCNEISGTDGYIIPPPETKEKIVFFQVDLCRSIELEFEEETTLFNLPARKYITTQKTLSDIEENKCYCIKHKDPETEEESIQCLKSGALNLTPCFTAPVIISWPHFYLADDEYKNYIIGLSPNKTIHENHAYVQTMTGIPLRGYKRAQINMFLIKNEEVSLLNNVSEGLFPILWIEEGTDLPENFRKMLKVTFSLLKIMDIFKPFIILCGFSCLIMAIVLYLKQNNMLCFAKDNQIFDVQDDDKSIHLPPPGYPAIQNPYSNNIEHFNMMNVQRNMNGLGQQFDGVNQFGINRRIAPKPADGFLRQ
ncbi:sensory neuron membrane protein 2-like [Chrysoperla carnea]|uniref:sensory neuron membrane protein 2-like n=1 Tax=Chrysoperla carnea TaxID=189513 RepID=UPI001D079F6B|nr:sensory neuron membrane protein 2-like [Chrysoperla carnea]